jgi:hypothetical protein
VGMEMEDAVHCFCITMPPCTQVLLDSISLTSIEVILLAKVLGVGDVA